MITANNKNPIDKPNKKPEIICLCLSFILLFVVLFVFFVTLVFLLAKIIPPIFSIKSLYQKIFNKTTFLFLSYYNNCTIIVLCFLKNNNEKYMESTIRQKSITLLTEKYYQ